MTFKILIHLSDGSERQSDSICLENNGANVASEMYRDSGGFGYGAVSYFSDASEALILDNYYVRF